MKSLDPKEKQKKTTVYFDSALKLKKKKKKSLPASHVCLFLLFYVNKGLTQQTLVPRQFFIRLVFYAEYTAFKPELHDVGRYRSSISLPLFSVFMMKSKQ